MSTAPTTNPFVHSRMLPANPIAAVIELRDDGYLIKRFYSRVLSAHSGAGARTGTGDAVFIRGEDIS